MTHIKAIDWLRGIAVLVMIQTHALTLLRVDLRTSHFFYRINWVDGLVAPSFIFAAGFSLALVQVRGANNGRRISRTLKSLRRIGEVLLVASFMVTLWFNIFREPYWLLRVDILQCIGISLLLALPIFALLAKRPIMLALISATIGVAILFFTAKIIEIKGLMVYFLGGTSRGATFPLLPWSSYIFLGGALGALAAKCTLRRLSVYVLFWTLGGVALWIVSNWLGSRAPTYRWGITNNHAERIIVVSMIIFVLLIVEQVIPPSWRYNRAIRFIELFGTSSLAAYFGHEVFLYKNIFGVCFNTVWKASAGWGLYSLLTVALIAITFVFTRYMAWFYERINGRKASSTLINDPRTLT